MENFGHFLSGLFKTWRQGTWVLFSLVLEQSPDAHCALPCLCRMRPPSSSAKLNNVRRPLTFKVSLLGIAPVATLYERRKFAVVFRERTLCIFPCNWWPFITYLCVGHSSVVMWSITHVNVSLQNLLNNIWTYSKKYNKRRGYRLMDAFSFSFFYEGNILICQISNIHF